MSEKLFKNKIPFYSIGEELMWERNDTKIKSLWASYKTNTIHQPIRVSISNYEDLMDKIKPFIYYLVSKYQNSSEWY